MFNNFSFPFLPTKSKSNHIQERICLENALNTTFLVLQHSVILHMHSHGGYFRFCLLNARRSITRCVQNRSDLHFTIQLRYIYKAHKETAKDATELLTIIFRVLQLYFSQCQTPADRSTDASTSPLTMALTTITPNEAPLYISSKAQRSENNDPGIKITCTRECGYRVIKPGYDNFFKVI